MALATEGSTWQLFAGLPIPRVTGNPSGIAFADDGLWCAQIGSPVLRKYAIRGEVSSQLGEPVAERAVKHHTYENLGPDAITAMTVTLACPPPMLHQQPNYAGAVFAPAPDALTPQSDGQVRASYTYEHPPRF